MSQQVQDPYEDLILLFAGKPASRNHYRLSFDFRG
jgi:hypothetical protein